MAQTVILAAAKTAGNSTDIVVAAGEIVKVGLFSTGPDELPDIAQLSIYEKTPGVSNMLMQLHKKCPTTAIVGPGTYFVYRPDIRHLDKDVGVYTED